MKRVLTGMMIGLTVFIAGLRPGHRTVSPTHKAAHTNCHVCHQIESPTAVDLSTLEAALPNLEQFATWASEHTAAADNKQQLATGIALATERRRWMKQLIVQHPDAALQHALSFAAHAALPPEVQVLVEEPFSETGDLEVVAICGTPQPAPAAITFQQQAGERYVVTLPRAHRVNATKHKLPVQGIRLDGHAVIRPSVFHELPANDIEQAKTLWPLAGKTDRCFCTDEVLGPNSLIAVSGGRIFQFKDRAALDQAEQALMALDALPGAEVGSSWVIVAADASSKGRFGFDEVTREAVVASNKFTTGDKAAFFIRVDFSDIPGAPLSAPEIEDPIDGIVSTTLHRMSYGKTTMDATVAIPTVRVDSPSSHYVDGPKDRNDLYNEAIANYIAAGYADPRPTNDTVGIYFTNIGFDFGGLASVGGQKMWLDGTMNTELVTHEFGHNYGLRHANYWDHSATNAASLDPVDPTGVNDEYGDDYDIMGDGDITNGDFHMAGKQRLNWIAAGEWTDLSDANDNGTYRVHRFDHINATGVRALRIAKSATGDHYWIGHRKNYTGLPHFNRGAYLIWEAYFGSRSRNQSWLVDSTPLSPEGKDDAPIALGRTYADHASDLYITPIALGGDSPEEYIDVVVNFGPFPGNQAPTASLSAPTTASARSPVTLMATANDPNADPLAYAWDLGDGKIQDNAAAISTQWEVGGQYTVSVTVSDMKGASVTQSTSITVEDPLTNWVTRTSGITRDLNALATNATHVLAVGDQGRTLRSSDGINWSTYTPGGFINNLYFHDVCWDGSNFMAAGMDYDQGRSGWEGVVYSSSDGTSWTRGYESDTVDTRLFAIVYDANTDTYVAVGQDSFGIRKVGPGAWQQLDLAFTANQTAYDLAYGGGRYVAVGRRFSGSGSPEVKVSTNGINWTDASNGTGLAAWMDFRTLYYTGERFLAGGFYARPRYSDDLGISWQTTQTGDRHTIDAFALGGGVIYAVGVNNDNSASDIDLLSVDGGVTWTTVIPPDVLDRNDLVFFNNSFISVGDDGSIRQSSTLSASEDYPTWIAGYYSGAAANPEANPDGDWAVNLVEYALGSDPGSGAAFPTRPFAKVDASGYWVIDIPRTLVRSELAYQVQWADGLPGMPWMNTGLTIMEDSPTLLRVRLDSPPHANAARYLRFNVIAP